MYCKELTFSVSKLGRMPIVAINWLRKFFWSRADAIFNNYELQKWKWASALISWHGMSNIIGIGWGKRFHFAWNKTSASHRQFCLYGFLNHCMFWFSISIVISSPFSHSAKDVRTLSSTAFLCSRGPSRTFNWNRSRDVSPSTTRHGNLLADRFSPLALTKSLDSQ